MSSCPASEGERRESTRNGSTVSVPEPGSRMRDARPLRLRGHRHRLIASSSPPLGAILSAIVIDVNERNGAYTLYSVHVWRRVGGGGLMLDRLERGRKREVGYRIGWRVGMGKGRSN